MMPAFAFWHRVYKELAAFLFRDERTMKFAMSGQVQFCTNNLFQIGFGG